MVDLSLQVGKEIVDALRGADIHRQGNESGFGIVLFERALGSSEAGLGAASKDDGFSVRFGKCLDDGSTDTATTTDDEDHLVACIDLGFSGVLEACWSEKASDHRSDTHDERVDVVADGIGEQSARCVFVGRHGFGFV
jgi:hypothetical protein